VPNAPINAASAPSSPDPSPAAIEGRDIVVGYGPLPVLRGISIVVGRGQVVALLGANGAGKTTALLALAGELPITSGQVLIEGKTAAGALHQRARRGLRLITEDRGVLMTLSVADNLRLVHKSLELPLEIFPELKPLLRRKVGLLSGGEQQMLALARALAGSSTILLADELSLGLAPTVVQRLLRAVRAAADAGMAVLLVEQQIRNAMSVADRVYVMKHGRIALAGSAAELKDRVDEVRAAYLAGDGGGRANDYIA
jgi:branched-chain amino acid transport system ATP-binding protein